MRRDLFGASLGGDVLCLCELCTSAVTRKGDQVPGHHRHRSAGALLPGSVRGGVDHDLPHGTPAGMVGVAAGDQEARQGIGHALSLGL